jgi:hypothetical protein
MKEGLLAVGCKRYAKTCLQGVTCFRWEKARKAGGKGVLRRGHATAIRHCLDRRDRGWLRIVWPIYTGDPGYGG